MNEQGVKVSRSRNKVLMETFSLVITFNLLYLKNVRCCFYKIVDRQFEKK